MINNSSSKNPEQIDMLDIINLEDGQPALSINGAIIGTEQEIIDHLKKSENYDELKELFLKEGGVSNE